MFISCKKSWPCCMIVLQWSTFSPYDLYYRHVHVHVCALQYAPCAIIWYSNETCIAQFLACVASVSMEQRAKKRETGFSSFCPRKKWGKSKNKKEGVGEGKEGNACCQALWFSNTPFAWKRSSWLAGLVDHVSIKGLKVLSARKKVQSLFTKSVNFSHGMSI